LDDSLPQFLQKNTVLVFMGYGFVHQFFVAFSLQRYAFFYTIADKKQKKEL